MNVRVTVLVLGAALLFAACDSGTNYPNKNDDDYDLAAMQLTEADMPADYVQQGGGGFTNEEWANLFDADDPDAKRNQLDAQGRIRNEVSGFGLAQYSGQSIINPVGRIRTILSQSTLFTDNDRAEESLRSLCGLLLDEQETQPDEFDVPNIGDGSAGFTVSQDIPVADDPPTVLVSVQTNVCFRTGRIVHVVQQEGFDGTQDIAQAVSLAKRMLNRVDAAFEGKVTPTPSAEDEATGTPEASPTRTATTTPGASPSASASPSATGSPIAQTSPTAGTSPTPAASATATPGGS